MCPRRRAAIGRGRLAALLGLTIAVGILAFGVASAATVQERGRSDRIGVSLEGDRLTIDVRDAPLVDVLRAVGERAGLRIKLKGDLDRPVSFSFTLRLDEALRRLARDCLVMIYEPSTKEAEGPALSEVLVCGAPDSAVVTLGPASDEVSLGRIYQGVEPLDYAGKKHAIQQLGEDIDDETIDSLKVVLALEENSALRRMAAGLLGQTSNVKAVAALGEALEDSHPYVRVQAARELAKIGGEEAAQELLTALKDPEWQIRSGAVRVLGKIHGEGAADLLGEVLLDEEDPVVRKAVVSTLEEQGGTGAWWPLWQAADDPDPAVRELAKRALEKLATE